MEKKKKLLNSLFVWLFLIVYFIKDAENLAKISFYAFFFILMCGLLLYFKARNAFELANFYGGVILAFIALFFFNAIPFIEGWTRHGSFLQEALKLPFPVHHSLLAIVLSPLVILLYFLKERLPAKLHFSVFLLFGLFLFAIISQIPEIIHFRNLFF